MAIFLVVRDLPGVTRDQYVAAQHATVEGARLATACGRRVRYLAGYFLLGRGQAMCVFDAESMSDVKAVNQGAGVPFTEVMEAIELRPGDLPF